MVISSIVVLTMVAVEFAFDARISYRMALHERERLQAYYLARSAYNLTLLELKVGPQIQQQISSLLAKANISVSVDLSSPLCQQFPIQTGLFRMAAAGAGEGGGEESGEGKNGAEAGANPMAGLNLSGVEEFLQFDGDFDASCTDEGSKINLNYFYDGDPSKEMLSGDNPYDDYKKFIITVLSQPRYAKLFEDYDFTVTEIVHNIADWVDKNRVINTFGGSEGGGEDSAYRLTESGQMTTKNGKFSTPQDIYRVAGVEDRWWIPVSEMFTIYGMTGKDGKGQINVCSASEDVVRALILRYIETRKDLPPLPQEEGADEEVMRQLVDTVTGSCTGGQPDGNAIAGELDQALVTLLQGEGGNNSPTPTEGEGGESGEGDEGNGGGVAKSSSKFADWISTESRFYSLKLQGRVKDTVVRIDTVMDLGEGGGKDPQKWKTLYWRIY